MVPALARNYVKEHLFVREFCRSRSKATSKREMAAGVTPDMRDACPIEAGRTRCNFSNTSREKPVIEAYWKV
jgi:hypothetical protein